MSLILSQFPSTLLTKKLFSTKCEEKEKLSSSIISKLSTFSFQEKKVFSKKSTVGDFLSIPSNFPKHRKYFLSEKNRRGKHTTVKAQNDFQKKSEEILDRVEMAVGEAAANVTIVAIDARVKAQDAAEAVGSKVKEANQTVQDMFSEPKSDSDANKKNDEDLNIDAKDKIDSSST